MTSLETWTVELLDGCWVCSGCSLLFFVGWKYVLGVGSFGFHWNGLEMLTRQCLYIIWGFGFQWFQCSCFFWGGGAALKRTWFSHLEKHVDFANLDVISYDVWNKIHGYGCLLKSTISGEFRGEPLLWRLSCVDFDSILWGHYVHVTQTPWFVKEFVCIWVLPKMVGFPSKSSLLIGISIINHPFWGPPIFGNTHMIGTKIRCGFPVFFAFRAL